MSSSLLEVHPVNGVIPETAPAPDIKPIEIKLSLAIVRVPEGFAPVD